MSDRAILITGANGALGRAIAAAFLQESAENFVWLGVRQNRGEAGGFVQSHPERARCVSLDVTQRDSWQAAVEEIGRERAPLAVLVNNAGVHEDGLLANLSEDSWRRVLATNLDAVYYGCQTVLPGMISARHGRIVNISSLSALLAPAGQTNYAAAKAGVVALTQSLAKEVARIGITVNAVCPGYIETGALAALSGEARKAALGGIPMRRFGQPAEVAAAVRFLACPEASYITGSVLKVDGGIF